MKTAGVNLGALPLQCETRSLIQALNSKYLFGLDGGGVLNHGPDVKEQD